ncbi:MAG: primosomal protein N' [Bacteroidota bacterium]|nr:primosomal protein N' [Bacteroidota bacterium]
MSSLLAEVIVPIPVAAYYTYIVPEKYQDRVFPGSRVIVPLGKSRLYTGMVRRIHQATNVSTGIKTVLGAPDKIPFVQEETLSLWEWIASYYHCYPGDVYKAAIPSYFRNFDDIFVTFRHDNLPDDALFLIRGMEPEQAFNLKYIIQTHGSKKTGNTLIQYPGGIESMEYHSHLHPAEMVIQRNKPVRELINALESQQGAPAQQKVLDYFISNKTIKKSDAKKHLHVSDASIKKARDAGWIKQVKQWLPREKQRFDFSGLPAMNAWQETAYHQIKTGFEENKPCLLHGITSSGKTLIYLHLIKECIAQGKQVLYLLPEIALTTQIIERLRESTGTHIEVFHSKFSGKAKLQLWENIQSGHAKMVVGARSAVFMPFKNFGLIIVDEEHDSSFKQSEPAPRYNARDVAVMMAHNDNIPIVMGSATPAGESYYNAVKGKYAMVELNQRYRNMPLPDIRMLDVKNARKRKIMEGEFHPDTLTAIHRVLERHGQVIVLRNRKGFAPVLTCRECGWKAMCPHCSVHLTYHKQTGKLKCHHCSYSVNVPPVCPQCGNPDLKYLGYGTQKVEEDLQMKFPSAKITRFDQDSLTSGHTYQNIISGFENGNTDILVGTQILTKGLDFLNVRLIVVLHADQMLTYPDFRAFERGYQMLEQVSGRTGRHHSEAEVLIQTEFAGHPILKSLVKHDYKEMMHAELSERRQLKYPPFVHLIHIYLKSSYSNLLIKRSMILYNELQLELGAFVNEPAIPVTEREAGQYRRFIQIRLPKDKKLMQRKKFIQKKTLGFGKSAAGKKIRLIVDADPA